MRPASTIEYSPPRRHERVGKIGRAIIALASELEILGPRPLRQKAIEAAHEFAKAALDQSEQFVLDLTDQIVRVRDDFVLHFAERLPGRLNLDLMLGPLKRGSE
jgi:hypothetical protein